MAKKRNSTKTPAPQMEIWDWKEQPDWDAINKALPKFQRPVLVPVDTGADCYAVVILEKAQKRQAQMWYDGEMEEME